MAGVALFAVGVSLTPEPCALRRVERVLGASPRTGSPVPAGVTGIPMAERVGSGAQRGLQPPLGGGERPASQALDEDASTPSDRRSGGRRPISEAGAG